jgi:hypothetical protein
MERQTPTTQVQHDDAFSKALIESAARYLGEESIPSLEKKADLDDFSQKDPKAKASPADPAIVLSTGGGPKQSHGAEIKYTNVVKKEEVELMPDELVGTTYEAVLETGEIIIIEKEKGLDGKACWKGYKQMGTKKKGGKTVDNCVKEEDESKAEEEKEKKLSKSAKEKHEKAEDKAEKKAGMKEEKGGADKKDETKFHSKLDTLVHKTFGKRPEEKKKMKEQVTLSDIVEKAVGNSKEKFLNMIKDKKKGDVKDGSEKDDKATASVTSKDTDKFTSAKKKEVKEGLDPVGKEDSDVNNDGKSDKQDKFLKGRRAKVGKILAAKKKVDEMLALEQEIINEKKR